MFAELTTMFGTVFTPSEALSAGLVDELAPDAASAEAACRAKLEQLLLNDPDTVREAKSSLRRGMVERFLAGRKKEAEEYGRRLTSPQFKAFMGNYLNELKSKKKKK